MICISMLAPQLRGQLVNAEKTLLHTQTGKTLDKGELRIYNNMNFYTRAGDYLGSLKPDNFQTTNYWLVAGNMMFSYGFMDHFDVSLGVRLYQDTHYDNEFNLPDDVFLTFRAASFGFARNHFQHGLLAGMRIPTAEVHNYPFAEYASGALEYGFMWAVSYYADPYLPERKFNMHFNIGWWNHNEKGTVLYEFENAFNEFNEGDQLEATKSSNELRMALAAVIPSQLFDFRMELSGMLYLNKTDPFVYSAEEWAFFTPSLRFKPADWANIDLGIDFRLSSDRQWTSGIPDISSKLELPPNYPSWKVQLGAGIDLNVLRKDSRKVSYEQAEAQKQIDLFEEILEEQEKAKQVEDEIENLRTIRKEADDEIEELKKILED